MDRVILYRKSVAIVDPVATRRTITDVFRVEKNYVVTKDERDLHLRSCLFRKTESVSPLDPLGPSSGDASSKINSN